MALVGYLSFGVSLDSFSGFSLFRWLFPRRRRNSLSVSLLEDISTLSSSELPSLGMDDVGERRERRTWTPTDDILLISSWLNSSKDPVVSNEQKSGTFWKRVAAYFSASPKVAGCEERSAKTVSSVGTRAHEIFHNNHKKKFTLELAWKEFRNDQKWCEVSSAKNDGSSKKRKCEDGADSSASQPSETKRPAGVKASKARGKKTMSEENSVNGFQRNFVDLLHSQQSISFGNYEDISTLSSSQLPSLGTDDVGERRERRTWTPTDDILLISSPKVAGCKERSANNCKQRWHKINDLVCKFYDAYEAATREKSSGCNENDKWCEVSSAKNDGSSKKRKCEDGADSSASQPSETKRPAGVKASKARGKKTMSEENSVNGFQSQDSVTEWSIENGSLVSRCLCLKTVSRSLCFLWSSRGVEQSE
ncbi:hypothetical protein F2Q68_00024314 [Brassica cretica]|uniref:Myb-like domain-containing protein n=1 Tax=Brassica cretica TaxID=69181 RepID=A0A8S9I9W9_BRACR|nr:hypothetical protein F2Q68_00024314 [Brassica cretica]